MSKNIKKLARDKVKNQNKPSSTKDASVNRAGGIAIDLEDNFDSITKLITMTGGSFFSEPKYYSFDTPTRGNDGKINNLNRSFVCGCLCVCVWWVNTCGRGRRRHVCVCVVVMMLVCVACI